MLDPGAKNLELSGNVVLPRHDIDPLEIEGPCAGDASSSAPSRGNVARVLHGGFDPFRIVLAALAGLLTGVAKTGVPGFGILAVPLMVYVVGVPEPHVAIGTSAIAVAANAAVNLSNHARRTTPPCRRARDWRD